MEIKCTICKNKKNINNIKFLDADTICKPICFECINYIKREHFVLYEEYILKNNEIKKIYREKYKKNNKEKQLLYQKKEREKNKEYYKKYREEHKLQIKEYNKKYREEHPEKFKQYQEKRKMAKKPKTKENIQLNKIKNRTRSLINKSFIRKGYKKGTKTEKILGCNFDDFYTYLLQTFKNNYGYEWDGKEQVDIDHKNPLKFAKTEEEVIKLCHYTNLQLLKRVDNRKKSAKIL